MNDQIDRRTFLTGIGATAATVGLAGCSGGGGSGDGDTGGGGSGDGDTGGTIGDDARGRVEGYVTSDNFDGTIVDATGEDSVTVEVGAEGNGGAFAFAPPAVAISPGTTVVWEWTGEGGAHNVVSDPESDFEFSSGNAKISGDPFEQSFDDTGVGLYVCQPHRSLNMNGAVVVVEE